MLRPLGYPALASECAPAQTEAGQASLPRAPGAELPAHAVDGRQRWLLNECLALVGTAFAGLSRIDAGALQQHASAVVALDGAGEAEQFEERVQVSCSCLYARVRPQLGLARQLH